MELSPKQLKNLEKTANFLDNPEVSTLETFMEIDEKFDEIEQSLQGLKEELDEVGERERVITEADIEKIAGRVKVPIVEKVIEKTEVIRETPIVTENVVEVAKYETAEVIVQKVNNSEELIDKERIKGLKDILEYLSQVTQSTKARLSAGVSGVRLYVNELKKGLLNSVNFKAGAGMTLTHSKINGLDTITFDSSGGVDSVSNIDGTLNISPTTGDVVASLDVSHANVWTGQQTLTDDLLFNQTTSPQDLGIRWFDSRAVELSSLLIDESGNVTFQADGGFLFQGSSSSTFIATLSTSSISMSGSGMTLTSGGQITLRTAIASTLSLSSNTVTFGNTLAGANIVFNFDTTTNDGVLTWARTADQFQFSDDVLMNTNEALFLRDANQFINSQAAGYLDYTTLTAHRYRMNTADTDVRFEYIGTTNSGLMEWMEDEDYFRFSDDLLMSSGEAIYLRDTGTQISSPSTGILRLSEYYIDTVTFGSSDPILYHRSVASPSTNYAFEQNSSGLTVFNGTGVLFRVGNLTKASITTGSNNFTIGAGATGIDYGVAFDGETNDGLITWMEDEDYFQFADDISIAVGERIYLDVATTTAITSPSTSIVQFLVSGAPFFELNAISEVQFFGALGQGVASNFWTNTLKFPGSSQFIGSNTYGGTYRTTLSVINIASSTGNLIDFNTGSTGGSVGTTVSVFNSLGYLGIGVTSPTAKLHLGAGSATANTAPIQLTSGTIETSPRAGLMEYDGKFYLSNSTTRRFSVGGSVFNSTTQTGNTAATETNLFQYSYPFFTVTGERLHFYAAGTFAATASVDKRIRVYAGSTMAGRTLIFDSGVLAITTANTWVVDGEIIYDGSTAKTCVKYASSSAALTSSTQVVTPVQVNNATNIDITGSGTNANDTVGELASVNFYPSA